MFSIFKSFRYIWVRFGLWATRGVSVLLICPWAYKTMSTESPSAVGWRIFLVGCFPGLLQRKALGRILAGAFPLPGRTGFSSFSITSPYLSCWGFGNAFTLAPSWCLAKFLNGFSCSPLEICLFLGTRSPINLCLAASAGPLTAGGPAAGGESLLWRAVLAPRLHLIPLNANDKWIFMVDRGVQGRGLVFLDSYHKLHVQF